MKLFGKYKFRRRQVRKFVWIVITAVAAGAMVLWTVAPIFRS